MGEKIKDLDVSKEDEWLYYAKEKGGTLRVFRSKMNRGGGKMENPKREELVDTGVRPNYDKYIYYVDNEGNLGRAERKNA
ncbi:hypothetical protein C9439_02045 [archaeon SCG-AAA382B04]|nr:hypothetical protein C9439_02045 [archaeon SCG-AAA382B04]